MCCKGFFKKLAYPFVFIANFFKSIFRIFLNGDILTKSSFLLMGISNFFNKQIMKGIIYLSIEFSFIAFMIGSGGSSIKGLVKLGTKTQGWNFDEELGINVLNAGDNSMLILIYGVISLIFVIAFFAIYILNIKSADKIQYLKSEGKVIPSFKKELSDLVDKRFHTTLLILPIIGIIAFTIIPIIFMMLIAFTNYDSAHQPPGNLFTWVGFENFSKMFSGNSKQAITFFPVLIWTFTWAVLATVSNYIFGIIVALMINKKGIKFKVLWRTIFILTMAIPQFVLLFVMRNMLNEYGPINEILKNMGLITQSIPFLTDVTWARIMVLTVNLWIGIPYTMLITSGILMNIPKDMYESARIDGASPVKMFFKITLPYILFVTAPYLITQFIGNINNFNIIYLLTRGEPSTTEYYFAGKTDLLITWLYKLTAEQKDYNVASTIGICVFVISIVIALSAYRRTASYGKEEQFS